MVERNEVDTSSLWCTINDERSEVISFTVPIENIEYQLVMKRPVMTMSWATYVNVFDTRYWVLFLLVSLTFTLYFGVIFTHIDKKNARTSNDSNAQVVANIFSGCAIVGLALGALDISHAKRNVLSKSFASLRFLALLICVFGMVNYYVYNAGLVARVLAMKPGITINSLDDFLVNTDYTLLVQEGSAQETYLKNSSQKIFRKVYEMTKNKNGLLGNENVNEGEQQIRKDPYKVFFVEYPLFQVMEQHARHAWLMQDEHHGPVAWTDPCELVEAKKRYGLNSIAMAFNKESPYIKLFNYHIRQIKEKGLATESYNPNGEQYQCSNEGSGNQFRPFSYDDVFSAFVIYGIGCVTAIAYLVFEKGNFFREKIRDRYRITAMIRPEYFTAPVLGSKEKNRVSDIR